MTTDEPVHCRHCAMPIIEASGNWRHAQSGEPACSDVLGRAAAAEPTRAYVAARQAGFATIDAWHASWPTWAVSRVYGGGGGVARNPRVVTAPTPQDAIAQVTGDTTPATSEGGPLWVVGGRRYRVEVIPA